MIANWGQRLLLGAALAALGGCVSVGGGTKAPPTLLTLSAQGEAAAPQSRVGDVLVVDEPEADRRLAVARVPVRISASQLAYLKDAEWVERPTRLFRNLLAEVLRAGNKRQVMVDDETSPAGSQHLAGRLLELGYEAGDEAVVVRYDAIRGDGHGGLITRRFEARVGDVAPKPDEVGPALNRAANDVAAQVAAWMAS